MSLIRDLSRNKWKQLGKLNLQHNNYIGQINITPDLLITFYNCCIQICKEISGVSDGYVYYNQNSSIYMNGEILE